MKPFYILALFVFTLSSLTGCNSITQSPIEPEYLSRGYLTRTNDLGQNYSSISSAHAALGATLEDSPPQYVLVYHGLNGPPVLVWRKHVISELSRIIISGKPSSIRGMPLHATMTLVFVDANLIPVSNVGIRYRAGDREASLVDLHLIDGNLVMGSGYQFGTEYSLLSFDRDTRRESGILLDDPTINELHSFFFGLRSALENRLSK